MIHPRGVQRDVWPICALDNQLGVLVLSIISDSFHFFCDEHNKKNPLLAILNYTAHFN